MIERIVAPLGLRVDATSPWVDGGRLRQVPARLPDGSRVQTRFLFFQYWKCLLAGDLLQNPVEAPSVRDPLQLVLTAVLERKTAASR